MTQIQDVPRLLSEFIELAKKYLHQETIEPAKKLGRYAMFSFVAVLLWIAGFAFVAVAWTKTLVGLLPDGVLWGALGYLLAAILHIVVVLFLVKYLTVRGSRSTRRESVDSEESLRESTEEQL